MYYTVDQIGGCAGSEHSVETKWMVSVCRDLFASNHCVLPMRSNGWFLFVEISSNRDQMSGYGGSEQSVETKCVVSMCRDHMGNSIV